jgi:hypothetical protein
MKFRVINLKYLRKSFTFKIFLNHFSEIFAFNICYDICFVHSKNINNIIGSINFIQNKYFIYNVFIKIKLLILEF